MINMVLRNILYGPVFSQISQINSSHIQPCWRDNYIFNYRYNKGSRGLGVEDPQGLNLRKLDSINVPFYDMGGQMSTISLSHIGIGSRILKK